ncbi:MAG: single-stranded DNA-binding protein [Burkholderiaceae bacterium]|nr:single-stranded DNA-binding protein [Burkholderiaceae bacterium]
MSVPTPQITPQKIGPNQCLIAGRLESFRRFEDVRLSLVAIPAPDPYSRPGIVEIRSNAVLGQRGDDVQVLCKIGGYKRKAYEVVDKKTGESTTVVPIQNTFDAVEQ